MNAWSFAVTLVVVSACGAASAAEPASAPPVGETIQRSLTFLVKDSLKWKEDHDCLSCHHGGMVAWALHEAGARGYAIDQPFLADLTHWIASSGDGANRIPKRPAALPRALNGYAVQMALALAADPQPSAEVREGLLVIRKTIRGDQIEDGSWVAWPDTRPPIFGPSNAAITALATLSLASGAENAADKDSSIAARDRGLRWLERAAADPDLQATSMNLLVSHRYGQPETVWKPLLAHLLSQQRPDGGWAQTAGMESDAFATGQALYALTETGVKASAPVIRKGQTFLVKTQRPDGSWPMTSRPCPPTNKGSTNLIPITGAGAAWGTLGLVKSAAKTAMTDGAAKK